jgi:hypothetical protein
MMHRRFHDAWLMLLLALAGASPLLAQAGQIPPNAVLSDQFESETRLGQLAATRTLVVLYSAEREGSGAA